MGSAVFYIFFCNVTSLWLAMLCRVCFNRAGVGQRLYIFLYRLLAKFCAWIMTGITMRACDETLRLPGGHYFTEAYGIR